jgi:hypothetical protein
MAVYGWEQWARSTDCWGIGNCDRDTYNGTRTQLLTDWPFTDNNQLVG